MLRNLSNSLSCMEMWPGCFLYGPAFRCCRSGIGLNGLAAGNRLGEVLATPSLRQLSTQIVMATCTCTQDSPLCVLVVQFPSLPATYTLAQCSFFPAMRLGTAEGNWASRPSRRQQTWAFQQPLNVNLGRATLCLHIDQLGLPLRDCGWG